MANGIAEALAPVPLAGFDPTQGTPIVADRPIQVQDPQVVEQNKGLWRGFFDKIKTDPNFRQSVLMTGINMMRSPKMGESGWDVASNALQGGVMTLEGLRQRDAEEELKRKQLGLQERGVVVQERGAATQEKTAETYSKVSADQAKQAQDNYKLKQEELAEAIRSNKSNEEINKIRAEADRLRAQAYSTGGGTGRTPQQIEQINILAAKYQMSGMDEITARAMAVEYLTETGKAKSPSERVRLGLETRIKAYNSSMEALQKPLSNEMIQTMLQETIALEQQLAGFGAPTGPTGGGGGVAPFDNPGADPKVVAQVQEAMSKGTPPESIRTKLTIMGLNPDLYLPKAAAPARPQ